MNHNHSRIFFRFSLLFFSVITLSLMIQSSASATTYYVSPSGSGAGGLTWKTAWTDPAKIDWTKVASGDQIHIDGGGTGITYNTTFTVPVSGVIIRQAVAAGHNGPIVFSGQNAKPAIATGVTFQGSNIYLIGNSRGGITLYAYAGQSLDVHTGGNVVRNVQFSYVTGFPPYAGGQIGGVTFGGANNHFIGCDFRDTVIGAVEKPLAGAANLTVFRDCTFGANGYGFFMNCGEGIKGAQNSTAQSTIYAEHCVFGPYVDTGVDFNSGNLHVTNCLFLVARVSNLNMTPAAGSTARATVDQCTFYEKKLTFEGLPYGIPANEITTNGNGTLKVSNSIVYGGAVNVPATQKLAGTGNVQFAVSGNTTTLAPTLVDPQFVDNATLSAAIAPTSFIPRTVTSLDFAPAAGSPATGKGSPIVRVSDICAAYGPIYGMPTAVGGP